MSAPEPTARRMPIWPANYRIHVHGLLDPCWSEWLDGLTINHLESGHTVIHGSIVDQAALLGILTKVCNLNLDILWMTREDVID